MSLAKRVVLRREEKGWSQGDLAKEIRRIDPTLRTRETTISAIENSRSKNPTILYQLAMALGVTEAWLKTGREPKFPSRMTATEIDSVLEHVVETLCVALETIGMPEDEAKEFSELVLEAAQEPIVGVAKPTTRDRRILASSLLRRSLLSKPLRISRA